MTADTAIYPVSHARAWRRRTELECDRKDLCERMERLDDHLEATRERLFREMETSIRLGTEVVALQRSIRGLESKVAWLTRKLGE